MFLLWSIANVSGSITSATFSGSNDSLNIFSYKVFIFFPSISVNPNQLAATNATLFSGKKTSDRAGGVIDALRHIKSGK